MANARTKIVFQTSEADSSAFAREFGSMVEKEDFLHLGKYEALAKIATADGISSPLTMVANEPAKPAGTARWVRYASRQPYGMPAGDVASGHCRTAALQSEHEQTPAKIVDVG